MRELKRFVEDARTCSYLPDRLARLEYRLLLEVTPGELERLLERGWRRFGPTYFRPACARCASCDSLRVPVDRLQPTDSQLRALRRCRRFRAEWGPPQVNAARLELYRRWHGQREEVRGWAPSPLDAEEYFHQFAFPHPSARELSLHDGNRLVAVGICDETPQALSAVYFFYDPDIARLSPGVANVMLCAERARETGREYLYLGYRVQGCASLAYKGGFRPHEQLVGRPGPGEEPRWESADGPPPPAGSG